MCHAGKVVLSFWVKYPAARSIRLSAAVQIIGSILQMEINGEKVVAVNHRQRLREQILGRRDELAPEVRQKKSLLVMKNVLTLAEIDSCAVLFAYVNFRSEVDTLNLIRVCLARGIKVAVPYTDVAGKRLNPYLINDPEKELKPGYCGIPEPVRERLVRLDAAAIDTVIMPGSVFDEKGGRLGYGGGYYDRFLEKEAPSACRIGLAFEEQVVPEVPLLSHDKRIHILVTGERIIRVFQQQA